MVLALLEIIIGEVKVTNERAVDYQFKKTFVVAM